MSSLEKDELEEMKNELIFIKNIFIKPEEEEEKMGDAVDGKEEGGEGGGGKTKGKGVSGPWTKAAELIEVKVAPEH